MRKLNYQPWSQTTTNPSCEGPMDAKILFLAEAPGQTEMQLNRPLCGQSGQRWNTWLMFTGIHRVECRIENFYPDRPKKNDISSIPTDDLIWCINHLHNRVATMPNLRVIVPMGNYALFALLQKGKVKAGLRNAYKYTQYNITDAEKKAGITQMRGSLYPFQDLNGREIKIIPMIHPAATLRMPMWAKSCVADLLKVQREVRFKQIIQIERKHITTADEDLVAGYAQRVLDMGDAHLALDIETNRRSHMTCIGFAHSPVESFTIDTTTKAKLEQFMPYIKQICSSDTQKILCNGLYDNYWLDGYHVGLHNYTCDVQYLHHAIDPVNKHSLDFLTSLYTYMPYWKDEAKDSESIQKYSGNIEALLVYNGMDCCATYEVWFALKRAAEKMGMFEFYQKMYVELMWAMHKMSCHGVRTDVKAQKSWSKQLKDELEDIRKELETGAGENLFSTKTKASYRDPTNEEWDLLLLPEEITYSADGVPKAKHIDKANRTTLIEKQKLTYMMSGAYAGKIRFSIDEDQKGFSRTKLEKFFFKTLGIPKQTKYNPKTKKRGVTMDVNALYHMIRTYPEKMGPYGKLLLKYREKEKQLGYLKGAYDKDHRTRSGYKPITEAGRLSSSKNPKNTGLNLQTIPQ